MLRLIDSLYYLLNNRFHKQILNSTLSTLVNHPLFLLRNLLMYLHDSIHPLLISILHINYGNPLNPGSRFPYLNDYNILHHYSRILVYLTPLISFLLLSDYELNANYYLLHDMHFHNSSTYF